MRRLLDDDREPARRFAEAVQLHQQGRLAEAEDVYRDILAATPEHPGALHLLGVTHHQRGDHATAVRLIGRAVQLAPKAVSFNNLGAALLALERDTEALDAFRRAVEIRPDHADARTSAWPTGASLRRSWPKPPFAAPWQSSPPTAMRFGT